MKIKELKRRVRMLTSSAGRQEGRILKLELQMDERIRIAIWQGNWNERQTYRNYELREKIAALEAELAKIREVMIEAINNCETCRGQTDDSRRCARCQTFSALLFSGKEIAK